MNYYEQNLIWDDVKLTALVFHDATNKRHYVDDYEKRISTKAMIKFSERDDQINYIVKNVVDEILNRILKYNRRFLILTFMQVKELSYTRTQNSVNMYSIHDLTNLLFMIISNNYDKFTEKYKPINHNKQKWKVLLKDIEYIVELGYLVVYALTNQDYLFDCIDNYDISDILNEVIYPPIYEKFYDNDYLKMDKKKKPEEYIIKDETLKNYINNGRKTTKDFQIEINLMFNKQYGFCAESLKKLQQQLVSMNVHKINPIAKKKCSIFTEYSSIVDIEKVFEFLNYNNSKVDIEYNKNSLHSMELHPVYIDDDNDEIIYSKSHLIYTLSIILNLIRSGDTQIINYYNFPIKEFEKIEGHINTYMESYTLGVLVELLCEKGYIVPKINYNDKLIPVADVKKIKEFGLNMINFDSDLFFADPNRKIVYNIDFKYSNSPVSLKLAWKKSEAKIPKYIEKLRERDTVIKNNLQKVKEILKIENVSAFSFKSALCMVRPNYYCYSNCNEWNGIYYTNWFRLIENLSNKKELLSME